MHEELIKDVVRFKVKLASKLIDKLPPEASKKLRSFGETVYEAVGAALTDKESTTPPKSGPINIE